MIALIVFVVLVVLVITNRIADRTYVGKALLALDYFASVLISRDFNITISSQCGLYWRRYPPPLFWRWLHILLNLLQKDHCELSILGDLARAQAAIKLLS